MGTKTATVTLADRAMRFRAVVDSGHEIVIDSAEGDAGPRPADLVGVALAACTAMDVISILRKKRQAVTGYEVRVTALQESAHPNAFTRFDLVHVIEGEDIDSEAVRRSIELSATRYCAVGATLASGAVEIHHASLIRDGHGRETVAEVLVIGPGMTPGEPPAGGG
jgi:putative redox protein